LQRPITQIISNNSQAVANTDLITLEKSDNEEITPSQEKLQNPYDGGGLGLMSQAVEALAQELKVEKNEESVSGP